MKIGKLTIKHQITVPKDVRKALGLKAGDHVMFEVDDSGARLVKVEYEEPSKPEWQGFTMTNMPEWFDPEEDAYWTDL